MQFFTIPVLVGSGPEFKPRAEKEAKMQLKVLVTSDRPDEYVGKKGLVKNQVIWEGLNGGMARVTLYSPLLDGVGYVLKGCEKEYQRAGGDFYETQKFGKRCDVMLSESVFRVIEGRRSIGVRRRQGQREAE